MSRLSLDKAIEREKEVAERNRKDIEFIKEDNKKYDSSSNSIINYENRKANDDLIKTCIKNVEYYEQIAEWLEELKKLRQCTNIENREYPYFNGFKEGKQVGYNKAIDDFVKEICKMIVQSENNGNYRFYAVEIKQAIADLAEQLKAGGTDA